MNNILSPVATITSTNAPPSQQQSLALVERADIHKSCKSLETLLNVLNDYCEAATAVVALQKKLAKALRETASSKTTNEIAAANALNASASIFEALAEVDVKFVKIADKEYDAISTEVKKWFKKLAKEEKAHDERIASANTKIKQAGLNFEKKSKKKPGDAQDEHSRYIHLISTLGPEITQEKYNHSLQTTQRHAATIYSVAACLARIADTEWTRSCESVRRLAPTVGPLSQWRSLCEGGWVHDIPGDLVDLEEKVRDNLKLNTIQERAENEQEEVRNGNQRLMKPPQDRQVYEHTPPPRYRHPDGESPTPDLQDSHQYSDRSRGERELTTSTSASYPSQTLSSSSGNSAVSPRQVQTSNYGTTDTLPPPISAIVPSPGQGPVSPATSVSGSPRVPAQVYPTEGDRTTTTNTNNNLRPPSPTARRRRSHSRDESPVSDDRARLFSDPNTGSVRSLSAFPAPPTHFPLPPPRARDPPAPASSRPSISAIEESREEQTYAARERLSESPLPLDHGEEGHRAEEDDYMPPPSQQQERPISDDERRPAKRQSNAALESLREEVSAPIPANGARMHATPPERYYVMETGSPERTEFRAKDFGVLRDDSGSGPIARARTFSGDVPTSMETQFEFPSASVPSQRRGGLVERTDTGASTSGNIVAAMKSRYSNTSGSRSPPPVGDLPRLHTSVTEMANRYQPAPQQGSTTTQSATHASGTGSTELREHQLSRSKQALLRPLTKSPPPASGRHTSFSSTPEKMELRHHAHSSSLTPTLSPRPLPNPGNTSVSRTRDSIEGFDERAQWRHVEARERDLREREQEINMREYELERDRARLMTLREGLASSSPSANSSEHGGHSTGDARESAASSHGSSQQQPRHRRISFRRSRQDSQPQTPQLRQDHLQPPSNPASHGNLIPSASSPNLRERQQSTHSYSSPPTSFTSNGQDYAALSTPASNSGNSTPYLSRSTGSPPPQSQQPEKKGGWMRRLSMPVGNALPFSLDSSKRHTNNSTSSTSSTSANVASPKAGTRQLGAGIIGGKGVADDRRNSTSLALGLGNRDKSARDYAYGQALQQQQSQEQDGHLGLPGLGRKSLEASRSASNVNLGLGRNK